MINADHFQMVAGRLSPQPWMQWRQVARAETPSVGKAFGVTGGGAKNELLQTVTAKWTNRSPIPQRVYGLVSQGGCSVVLQARSRAYLRHDHGLAVGGAPVMVADLSRFGGGADLGQGGIVGVGTGYAIHQLDAHSSTMPLRPDLPGWTLVNPGQTITGRVDVRFVSEFWESTPIDGGDSSSESRVISGALALDLFAVPVIGTPPGRIIPTVVGTSTGLAITKPVTVPRPAGTQPGDTLVAIAANQFGLASDITPPDGSWRLLRVVGDGMAGWEGTHLKVFARQATASDPATFTFGNGLLAEEIVHLMVVRGAAPLGGDADAPGWAVAVNEFRWAKTGRQHVAPSITRPGQLLICGSFFARTDNPLDDKIGPTPVDQAVPEGMVESVEKHGLSASLSVATLTSPPTPTGDREFVCTPRAFFSGRAIAVSILVPGGTTTAVLAR